MVGKDIKEFITTIPLNVTIIAATKYVYAHDMMILLESGIDNFGENRVDSFLEKYEILKDKNIVWHFIGHLQRNKAKEVINKIDYLHSLDSLKLANIIEKERKTPLNTFIEVSINGEGNKNGVRIDEVDNFIKELIGFRKINIVGLMMMAKANSSPASLKEQFAQLRLLRNKLEKTFAIKLPYLSMGMSDDYKYALEENATHIRLGRILFSKNKRQP